MFFNDHNTPHFHIEYQGYAAIIYINDGMIRGEIPRKELNLIYEWLDLNKKEILENWEPAINREPLKKIKPLEK